MKIDPLREVSELSQGFPGNSFNTQYIDLF